VTPIANPHEQFVFALREYGFGCSLRNVCRYARASACLLKGKRFATSGRVFTLTRYGERFAIVRINDSVDGVTCR
jgi:hypothetical protein